MKQNGAGALYEEHAKIAISALRDAAKNRPMVPGQAMLQSRAGPWLAATARRLHCNVLTVALANKLARIVLTVLVQGRSYQTHIERAAA